jgi:hypothetical protein
MLSGVATTRAANSERAVDSDGGGGGAADALGEDMQRVAVAMAKAAAAQAAVERRMESPCGARG